MAKTWQEIDEIGRQLHEYCRMTDCENCIIKLECKICINQDRYNNRRKENNND